jgi:predicted acylesterase/phospholipase RssA/CRP-like cAMP-binding protein
MIPGFLTSEFVFDFISKVDFLSCLDESQLLALVPHLEPTLIKSGDILFEQGTLGDCLYLVVNGRLQVFRNYGAENEKFITEIGSGRTVGEMSLLTQETRSGTVTAARDCILLKLKKNDFDGLVAVYPQLAIRLSEYIIKRLQLTQHNYDRPKTNIIKTVLFMPLTNDSRISDYVRFLANKIRSNAKVLYLTAGLLEEKGFKIDNEHLDQQSQNLVNWLNDQENVYDLIFFNGEFGNSTWIEFCKRQSDKVYLVSFNDNSQAFNLSRSYLLPNQRQSNHTTLLLLYDKNTPSEIATKIWLDKFNSKDHLLLDWQNENDLKRLIRIVRNQSIGIVLSGGGARGLAHIGFVKALAELKIPIDFVGGTSMGAVVSGLLATGLDAQSIETMAKEFSQQIKRDWFTYPYISITTGKFITEALKKTFGNQVIEDLALRSFYISTDLSNSKIFIHKQGLLWEAVRASVSLPVIYPPQLHKESILVDGAIMNNLPVDIMVDVYSPRFIVASTVRMHRNKMLEIENISPSFLQIIKNIFKAKNKKQPLSYLSDIITSTMVLHSGVHQKSMEKAADFCVVHNMDNFARSDFSASSDIIEKGYINAMEQLQSLDKFDE